MHCFNFSFWVCVFVWECLTSVLPVTVCECDSESLYCRILCLVCEQKLKTTTFIGENDNDSEASGSAWVRVVTQKPRIYYFTNRMLLTVWCSEWKLCCWVNIISKYHIWVRNKKLPLICYPSQLEATFPFKVFCFPAIASTFFFKFYLKWPLPLCTALCHWCHAEGVLCHLLLCFNSRHVDPFSFFTQAHSLSVKRGPITLSQQ